MAAAEVNLSLHFSAERFRFAALRGNAEWLQITTGKLIISVSVDQPLADQLHSLSPVNETTRLMLNFQKQHSLMEFYSKPQ